MRKLIALALVTVTLMLGAPAGLLAQTLGAITGQAVDAGGRAVVGQRVELVQAGVVIQTTTTGAQGAYSFSNVAAGDYIVRVMINGVPAGVRVSLAQGATAANTTIVTPAATAASGPFIVPILVPLLIAGGIAATVVTVAVVATGS